MISIILLKLMIYQKDEELYGEEEVDIRKYYEMMDIYICSSWSESFSLTIVESALERFQFFQLMWALLERLLMMI